MIRLDVNMEAKVGANPSGIKFGGIPHENLADMESCLEENLGWIGVGCVDLGRLLEISGKFVVGLPPC